MNATPGPTSVEERAKRRPWRMIVALVMIAALTLLYILRPVSFQFLHWWPMAIWTPLLLLPFVSLRPPRHLRPLGLCLLLWMLALIGTSELNWRFLFPAGAKSGYRVVSLNCAAGEPLAAAEAFSQDADIVLLQEVASRPEFEKVATPRGYRVAAFGPDAAIFVREGIAFQDGSKDIDHAGTTVELDGRHLKVVSLRLQPPVFRLDWWSGDCRNQYSEDFERRQKRLSEFIDGDVALFGGDFNATNPKLGTEFDATEAHRAVGRGWGGTGTNDFPFVRVDQIWGRETIRWRQAFVVPTKNSDHRMVVADFDLAPTP